jgi:hypothetical protein
MTPTPIQGYGGNANGWGNVLDSHSVFNNGGGTSYPNELSMAKSASHHYSNPSNMHGAYTQFDVDQQSLYDSKYSPSHTGNQQYREPTSQQHLMYGAK